MTPRLKQHWRRTPKHIRKPIVLVTGMLFVIAAGLIGWLPGPGGIPLFLVGIAILATEFTWAQRVRDVILGIIHYLGRQFRAHRIIGTLIIILSASISLTIIYLTLQKWH